MTPPPTLQQLIEIVRQDAGSDQPLDQLAAAAAAAAQLEETTDALLGHFVDRCRRAGLSWTEISSVLGVTKQAVHKRFALPLAERLTEVRGATFERFTPRARRALASAADAARERGHGEIGTGHLLLGLYAEPEGIAARVLLGMEISQEIIAAALAAAWASAGGTAAEADGAAEGPAAAAELPGAGEWREDRPPMSPAARSALLNAVVIALEFGHNYIGTEHILLALYRDSDSLAARVLAEAGASSRETQVRVTELLRGISAGQSPAAPGA